MCRVYITCSDKNKRSFDICKSKKRQKKTKRNTTPCLAVKTPTSQGAFVEMSTIGRTTARARVEGGKQRGNVAWGIDQRGRNRGIRPDDDGSCIWSGDDYRDVVMRSVRETN